MADPKQFAHDLCQCSFRADVVDTFDLDSSQSHVLSVTQLCLDFQCDRARHEREEQAREVSMKWLLSKGFALVTCATGVLVPTWWMEKFNVDSSKSHVPGGQFSSPPLHEARVHARADLRSRADSFSDHYVLF